MIQKKQLVTTGLVFITWSFSALMRFELFIQNIEAGGVWTHHLKRAGFTSLHPYPLGHFNRIRRRFFIVLIKGQDFLLLFSDATGKQFVTTGRSKVLLYLSQIVLMKVIFGTDEVRTLHTKHRSGWGSNSSSKRSRVHQPAPLSITF